VGASIGEERGYNRKGVPDMPDRIVAATAVYLGAPVIGRDGASALPMCERSGEGIPNSLRWNCLVPSHRHV
jgi:hypothetical protein